MGKAGSYNKKARRFRSTGASKSSATAVEKAPSAPASRGQKKRALKRQTLVKKMGMVAKIETARAEQASALKNKIKGFGGMSLLLDSLEGIGSEGGNKASSASRADGAPSHTRSFQRVVTNKGKKKVMAAEMEQFNAVLAASPFQENPFGAIQAHLKHTIAPPPANLERDGVEGEPGAKHQGRRPEGGGGRGGGGGGGGPPSGRQSRNVPRPGGQGGARGASCWKSGLGDQKKSYRGKRAKMRVKA